MKKNKLFALLIVSVLLLTGCSLLPFNNGGVNNTKPAKGNCNVFECIKKIDTKDNLEKVNKIMGFEGEKVNEGTSYATYKWVINEEKNEKVQVQFYTGSVTNYANVSITFSDEDIKNPNVDFSKYQEIKTAMNNRETVKYDDIKAKFKADGVLVEKTSYSTKYRWVDGNGKYLNASFGNTTGACTMILGRI